MTDFDTTHHGEHESSTATLDVDQHSREELMKLAEDLAFIEPLRLPRHVDVDELIPTPEGSAGLASSPATESVDDAVREQLLQIAEDMERDQDQ